MLDPFSGSATTLAVAKKLGRQQIGFDLSKEYVDHGRKRLDSIEVGDPLDGSPEPTKGGKPTKKAAGKKTNAKVKNRGQKNLFSDDQKQSDSKSNNLKLADTKTQ